MNIPADQAELFRSLFETAPDATVVVDRDGCIVLANALAHRVFGHEPGTLVGRSIEELLPPAMRTRHVAYRTRYVENPRVRPMGAGFELVGMRRDGTEFPIEISLSPVAAGPTLLYAASVRDISETQRARQALARARYDAFLGEMGRLAVESRDDERLLERAAGIVATAIGADGVAILTGPAPAGRQPLRTGLGLSPKWLDRLCEAITGATDAKTLLAVMPEAAFRDAAAAALLDRARTAGWLLAFSTQAHAFDRDRQQFLHSVAHLLSSALQRSRSEEQLRHAQRIEAIGQLTGGVAHDFNNLLTVISGNLQLLEDDIGGPEDRAQIIQSALRAVGNGAALTRKLLSFARRQRLAPRAIALDGWAQELSALLRRTLGPRIALTIDAPADLPPVYADPGELDAAVVNLALNARDAMPRGGDLHIELRERRFESGADGESEPGDYVVITVADTGLGMAPDVLARALEPFFSTKSERGSGLGLSMVYGFARQSGGSLSIDSELGYGTRASLLLPVAAQATQEAASPPRTERMRGEVVLVVEDEPDVRAIAVAFLRHLGYTTLEAGNADEALARIDDGTRIDLLFTDVLLGPGMTGIELVREAARRRPGMRALLTSGYEQPALADADARMPDADLPLLRKPYTRDALATSIAAALER